MKTQTGLALPLRHSMAAIAAHTPELIGAVRTREFQTYAPVVALILLGLLCILAIRRFARTARPGVEEPDAAAHARLLETEMLCAFIQETTHLDAHAKPGPPLASLIRSIFNLEAAAILDADLREIYRVGKVFDNVDEVLQNIYVFETASDDRETGLMRRVLRMGKLPIGAMLLRGETSATTADAVASVVAITFDRYHAFANESRTERARQTEQLRTTVLDSLAHAYKTPLTAIEAASGGLAAMGSLTPAQAGLVALIEEQADQLSQLTSRLLTTARLEASELDPQLKMVAVAPLIEDVAASLRQQLSNHKIKVELSREDLSLRCDRGLMVALLTQYLDNASKYADADTAVTVRAVEDAGAVVFSVRSVGAVVPEGDYERVFDRYYRCSLAENKAPGTGIGLAVAKRAAQAHGGDVWVTSDAVRGTIFYASLPTQRDGGVIQ